MSRIAKRFEQLRAAGRKGLIPYVTAGDPAPGTTVAVMHALVAAGADVLELGVPFSDPMADGPVIQAACERALAKGVRLADVLDMVAEFRRTDTDTPVILMGYLNPVEAMGVESFVSRAGAAGVDGVLLVDLPPVEAEALTGPLRQADLDLIFLASPTSSDARLQAMGETASGFIYYVSLKGVTGAASLNVDAIEGQLARIREHVSLPVGVGFGIRDADSARAVARSADAVIVGSALVERMHAAGADGAAAAAGEWLKTLRDAVDTSRAA